MIERVTLRPGRPPDFAFCQRLYFEKVGWTIEALRLDTAKLSASVAARAGPRHCRRGIERWLAGINQE
jgi:hypothetical protein